MTTCFEKLGKIQIQFSYENSGQGKKFGGVHITRAPTRYVIFF
jgi:hypothetical protein